MNKKELEEFWSPAFDDMADFVFLVDKEFTIAKCNRSFLEATGKNRDDVEGNRCYACVHGSDNPVHDCPHKRLIESQRYEEDELFEAALDIWLRVKTTPVFDKAGKLIGSIHIASDITATKRAEEELLEHMNQIKRINDMLVAREQRIIEIKREVNQLLGEQGKNPKYDLV